MQPLVLLLLVAAATAAVPDLHNQVYTRACFKGLVHSHTVTVTFSSVNTKSEFRSFSSATCDPGTLLYTHVTFGPYTIGDADATGVSNVEWLQFKFLLTPNSVAGAEYLNGLNCGNNIQFFQNIATDMTLVNCQQAHSLPEYLCPTMYSSMMQNSSGTYFASMAPAAPGSKPTPPCSPETRATLFWQPPLTQVATPIPDISGVWTTPCSAHTDPAFPDIKSVQNVVSFTQSEHQFRGLFYTDAACTTVDSAFTLYGPYTLGPAEPTGYTPIDLGQIYGMIQPLTAASASRLSAKIGTVMGRPVMVGEYVDIALRRGWFDPSLPAAVVTCPVRYQVIQVTTATPPTLQWGQEGTAALGAQCSPPRPTTLNTQLTFTRTTAANPDGSAMPPYMFQDNSGMPNAIAVFKFFHALHGFNSSEMAALVEPGFTLNWHSSPSLVPFAGSYTGINQVLQFQAARDLVLTGASISNFQEFYSSPTKVVHSVDFSATSLATQRVIANATLLAEAHFNEATGLLSSLDIYPTGEQFQVATCGGVVSCNPTPGSCVGAPPGVDLSTLDKHTNAILGLAAISFIMLFFITAIHVLSFIRSRGHGGDKARPFLEQSSHM